MEATDDEEEKEAEDGAAPLLLLDAANEAKSGGRMGTGPLRSGVSPTEALPAGGTERREMEGKGT
jgi:hypothetical protein